VRTGKQRCSTSPSKVYPKSGPIADFLLDERSVELDPVRSKIGLELLRGLEDNPRHPKAPGRFRIGGNVVNINSFLGPDLARLEGLAIDNWVWLARADLIGVDADGEEAEEGETRLLMGHMDWVGVRKQGQAVVLGQFFQESFRWIGFGSRARFHTSLNSSKVSEVPRRLVR